jgi:hypothetical protein
VQPYQNLSGNSGVAAYEIEPQGIRTEFVDGPVYLYTYESAGKENVETMKVLAENGLGLSTYIAQVVKSGYERKGR